MAHPPKKADCPLSRVGYIVASHQRAGRGQALATVWGRIDGHAGVSPGQAAAASEAERTDPSAVCAAGPLPSLHCDGRRRHRRLRRNRCHCRCRCRHSRCRCRCPSSCHHSTPLRRPHPAQEYDECLELIEEVLAEGPSTAEYLLHMKALVKRQHGQVHESSALFQAVTCLNPQNPASLKQAGRSLYLLGRHEAALAVYEQPALDPDDDWELWHNKGLCHASLGRHSEATASFTRANALQPHEATSLQLASSHTSQGDSQKAMEVLTEAIGSSPESAALHTKVGLLHLCRREEMKGFTFLGNALAHEPRDPDAILGAGSIIQEHSDVDVALTKYRTAVAEAPGCAQLWNNIGVCFFSKERHLASIACLKHALSLDHFEWEVAYNLGLVHLSTGQYASAFHFLSASINIKPDFASAYMCLAITLARLNDVENACLAYEQAIELDGNSHLFELNYAITLVLNGKDDRAREHFARFHQKRHHAQLESEAQQADADLGARRAALAKRLAT